MTELRKRLDLQVEYSNPCIRMTKTECLSNCRYSIGQLVSSIASRSPSQASLQNQVLMNQTLRHGLILNCYLNSLDQSAGQHNPAQEPIMVVVKTESETT